jgi:hypothetical protein
VTSRSGEGQGTKRGLFPSLAGVITSGIHILYVSYSLMGETSPDALLAFRETPLFMNRITKLAGERAMNVLFRIQQELLNDPERGDLIEGRWRRSQSAHN